MPRSQETREPLAATIQRWYADPGFRRRLADDPLACLRRLDLHIPVGVSVVVVTDTADTVHLVIPPEPSEELRDEELAATSAGATASSASSVSSIGTLACGCLPSTTSSAACTSSASTV